MNSVMGRQGIPGIVEAVVTRTPDPVAVADDLTELREQAGSCGDAAIRTGMLDAVDRLELQYWETMGWTA